MFGWTSRELTGALGTYTIFERPGGGDTAGALSVPNNPAPPKWLFYIATDDIDVTAGRHAVGARASPVTGFPGARGRSARMVERKGKSVERDEVAAYLADGWTCPTPEQFEKLRRELPARR